MVCAKASFGGVKNVVKYLARHSHRVGISNQRIVNIGNDKVRFLFKDYKVSGKKKVMTLSGQNFLQRFCMHILPSRFRRIRHYGFLPNASKKKRLNQAKLGLMNQVKIALTKSTAKGIGLWKNI